MIQNQTVFTIFALGQNRIPFLNFIDLLPQNRHKKFLIILLHRSLILKFEHESTEFHSLYKLFGQQRDSTEKGTEGMDVTEDLASVTRYLQLQVSSSSEIQTIILVVLCTEYDSEGQTLKRTHKCHVISVPVLNSQKIQELQFILKTHTNYSNFKQLVSSFKLTI